MWRVLIIDARRSPREHDALGSRSGDFRSRDVEANNFRVDLTFPNAPRNDLGVLRAKIENEDLGMRGGRRHDDAYSCGAGGPSRGFTYGSPVRSMSGVTSP